MAFATNTLVNGEWTTRTIDVDAVLRHYDQQDREASVNAVQVQRPPVLGLLTQTALRSPLVHWILRGRLRDLDKNDVAFIGIKEFRIDGLLYDVVQKNNFGARIRNARVIGSIKASAQKHKRGVTYTLVEDEDGDSDVEMNLQQDGDAQPRRSNLLPPQVILLQLDSGESVFLMLQRKGKRDWKFVATRQRVSKAMLMVQPGMHLVVDPSSRYVAIGCSEGLFAIYALNSRKTLNTQLSQGRSPRYIQSERYIYFHGIIHKMEFLYPSSDDDKHVILLVLLVWKGKTRMLLYEWESGGDLRNIRAHSRRGHLLEESRQMPLLVIPLTTNSSFILVCEDSMAVCKDILEGSPKFVDFNNRVEPPTAMHHGSGLPLWTAWTRPVRLPYHTVNQDDIYIVREDGFIKYLELHSSEEDIVRADMNIGSLKSNCGTALASLDYHPLGASTGDLLITGGESCVGGTYLVVAREGPVFRESIPNWSPAQDIVTTSRFQDREVEEPNVTPHGREQFLEPDRIFACVGKGAKGSITEFRHGLEARLGLETEFHMPVMDVWIASPSVCSAEDDGGSLFLLSLVNRSALLHLSSDASEIDELDQTSTFLDLRYRTIATSLQGDSKIQVTEQSVFFMNDHRRYTYEGKELLGIYNGNVFLGSGSRIDDAITDESIALFTTHFRHETYLQILDLTSSDPANGDYHTDLERKTSVRTLRKCSLPVTSLAICTINQIPCVVIAEWEDDSIRLTFQPFHGEQPRTVKIPATNGGNNVRLEAFVSISVSSNTPGFLVLVCGTRNGLAVSFSLNEHDLGIVSFWCDRLGATPVNIKRDGTVGCGEPLFMTCDSKLYTLKVPVMQDSRLNGEISRDRRAINQVWLTDAMNPSLQQPGVNSIARLLPNISDDTNCDILLVSGSQLLLASLSTQPKAVPRHLPIGGTPTRLLYSRTLRALLVAASVDGRCTLLFIDPETGADLSKPVDKKGVPVQFVSGLGDFNEKVFRLLEWSYMKDGKTWYFIVVSTNTGRLLIISTEKEAIKSSGMRMETGPMDESDGKISGGSMMPPMIRHWTRYKFKCAKPVYSVAGFADGLFYCSGNTLYCDILNLAEKKFQTVAQYELPSPALDLIHEDGKIYAITTAHSLEVLELVKEDGGASKIVHTHGDQVTRNALHHRVLGNSPEKLLSLISDKSCSVVGLWATHKTRADTLEPVFEAQLPHSILRFRSGRCRPIWDPTWPTSGKNRITDPDLISNSAGYPEILGLSIDGSLYHFTILDFASWKFLRFLVNLARQSPKICEFTYDQQTLPLEPVSEPKIMMHVDGDLLQRVEENDLQELLRIGKETVEAANIQSMFRELLQEMHGERLDKDAEMSVYIKRAYNDLGFFLRPVL